MSYLLDTNVLSELRRKNPEANVVRWFEDRPVGTLYLSVLTLGELRKGVVALPESARKFALLDWLETELPAFFAGRILPVDAAVADRWGQLWAEAGRPLPVVDSLLVATAVTHGLILVTRNIRHTQGLGAQLIDPWSATASSNP